MQWLKALWLLGICCNYQWSLHESINDLCQIGQYQLSRKSETPFSMNSCNTVSLPTEGISAFMSLENQQGHLAPSRPSLWVLQYRTSVSLMLNAFPAARLSCSSFYKLHRIIKRRDVQKPTLMTSTMQTILKAQMPHTFVLFVNGSWQQKLTNAAPGVQRVINGGGCTTPPQPFSWSSLKETDSLFFNSVCFTLSLDMP